MAFAIKRATGILTLKLTLLTHAQQLELSLERFQQGENVLENVWRAPLQDFGIPEGVSQSKAVVVTVPESIGQGLRDAVTEAAPDSSEALWLHFVKPYGLLGALDWETALIQGLGRPVVRLPDFLEPIRRHPDRLNVALICDLPSDEPAFDVGRYLEELISRIDVARPSTATFHVFAPERLIRPGGPPPTGEPRIQYADPAKPGEAWLDWVARHLEGQAIDWVQFLVHADADEGAPSLAFTAFPSHRQGGATATYLSPPDVGHFLNLISAWGVGFANPPDVSPDPLRYFADSVAQVRAGPVLFECLGQEDWHSALTARMEALFQPNGQPPRPLPAYVGGFLYIQPERLGLRLSDAQRDAPTDLSDAMATLAMQPGWAVSANSYLATARQEWGLGTALGSLSAPQTLEDPDVWQANTVGAFERIELKLGGSNLGAADETLKALSNLTARTLRLTGEGS